MVGILTFLQDLLTYEIYKNTKQTFCMKKKQKKQHTFGLIAV